MGVFSSLFFNNIIKHGKIIYFEDLTLTFAFSTATEARIAQTTTKSIIIMFSKVVTRPATLEGKGKSVMST